MGKRWKRGTAKPSAEEVRRHMISHWPFRSWCEFCVKGKSKDAGHYQVHRSDWEEEPVFSWDYMYMKTKLSGNASEEQLAAGTDLGNRPILVGKDRGPDGSQPMS